MLSQVCDTMMQSKSNPRIKSDALWSLGSIFDRFDENQAKDEKHKGIAKEAQVPHVTLSGSEDEKSAEPWRRRRWK